MPSIRERDWTDEELAEVTVVVMEWFENKGRDAARLVQAVDDFNADNFAEGISWLQDIADGKEIL
jgi:hypothetical protein